MEFNLRWLLSGIVAGLFAFPAQAADFYVSPKGNDSWSGKLAAPNSAGTDGPFASMDRARIALRDFRKTSGKPVVIQFRGGTYSLSKPVVFTPEDSGTIESPVIYEAYGNEKPVISGGTLITGWRKTADGKWQADLPDVASGEWNFEQLYVNDECRLRPRLPRNGYYYIGDAVPIDRSVGGSDGFRFKAGEINKDWSHLSDVEAVIFQLFTSARMRIASVDDQNGIVRFTGKSRGVQVWQSFPKDYRYFLDNVKEALSLPGEWYLDRPSGRLTYLPREGETMESAEVVAPRLSTLIELRGKLGEHQWVNGLTFKNLIFAHGNWVTPASSHNSSQSEPTINGAIVCEGARHCTFQGCAVVHMGPFAFELGRGSRHNVIEDCSLMDLGAGGIKIGGPTNENDAELLNSHMTLRNNTIAHGGRLLPAATAILVMRSTNNIIANNEIHDFYYTGVALGWTWGYAESGQNANVVENNHIYEIGQNVLADMSGIYNLGPAPGNVFRHNLIHDVRSLLDACGIYTDEGSSNILIENNIVYRTNFSFNQHYGRNNTIRNNIFALSDQTELQRNREEDMSFGLDHNIIYSRNSAFLGGRWGNHGTGFKSDANLYWDPSGKPIDFRGLSFEKWKEKGSDAHSVIADPLFVDPEKDDFRLAENSPAYKLGFKPIDPKGFGRLTPNLVKVVSPRAFPIPEQMLLMSEDFEFTGIGDKPNTAVHKVSPRGTLAVTDGTAASGKHSVTFSGVLGETYQFNPDRFSYLAGKNGLVTFRYALRLEPGSVIRHEWRGNAGQTGPSFLVDKDGALTAGEKRLTQLQSGRWVSIEVTCPVNGQADGTWGLTVSSPGEKALSFQKLKHNPLFKTLNWLGFVTESPVPSPVDLDDFKLTIK